MNPHRWKLSWPGNFCLDCGMEDPLESDDVLIDCDCAPPEDLTQNNGCLKCLGTGCILRPNIVVSECTVVK